MAKGPRTGRVGGRTSRVPARKHLDDLVKAAPLPPPAEVVPPVPVQPSGAVGRAAIDARSPRLRRGMSHALDPRQAARDLYEAVGQPDIAFVLVFCSPQYDLEQLGPALAELFGDTLVIGCTTAGEITPVGYMTGSITGVSFPRSDFSAVAERIDDLEGFEIAHADALVRSLSARRNTALENAAADDREPAAGKSFALLLIDGLSVREELVVSSIYSALGDIPLFGGSAGDDLKFTRTWILHDGGFRSNAAVLVLVDTVRRFTVFRTEHFVSSDRKMVVTEADPARRIVTEINAEPAGREYARMVGLEGEPLTPMIFAAYPVVVRVGGEYHVRSIQKVNDDESLTFFCAIDEGIVLTVAEGVDLVQNLESLFSRLHEDVGEPELILGCDCILRSLEMEQKQIKHLVSKVLARNNVIGFCTYGEQFNAMHVNQTFTGVAIGARCES
ncbi:nitric oxide-sensing protein NosP [Skermanella pratensis]|uniref:nitric oxide-sensing protein NosP n=1 Tax=Skermanella pratensis TaxID=2233999 RepID=UPI001FE87634|nr:nitric oxide-sensing protein NosP [Skermanella pratensis]